MSVEALGDAIMVSAVIAVSIVVCIAAVIYAFIKKKKDYDSKGIPKRVDYPEEHEGSTHAK